MMIMTNGLTPMKFVLVQTHRMRNDMPVDSFEIVIPGTQIGLGAWDLIGIFGGVPIFTWLAFGFVTRNKRCARYEEMLEKAILDMN